MRYLAYLLLIIVFLPACASTKGCARDSAIDKGKELLPPTPESKIKLEEDGTATVKPDVFITSLPPDASVEELEKALGVAQVQEADLTVKSAAASAQVKLLQERIMFAKQGRYQDWLIYVGLLSLLGIAACVALFFLSPVGQKTIVGIGCGFAAMVIIAFTFSSILPYLIYFAWGGIVGLVAYLLFVVFKQDKASQGLAVVGEKALSLLPKQLADSIKFDAAKEHIKAGIADAVSGTLTKVKKKFTRK